MDVPFYVGLLLVLIIIGAIIAIETTDLLSSVISLGAVGFLLSIQFLLLNAPNVAIMQLVVEVLCLVMLIRATISRDLTAVSGDREFFGLVVTVVLVFLFAILGLRVFHEFPAFGHSVLDRIADAPARTYLAEGAAQTGSANIVTAILLDFRAYDTLGQLAVFFCAIVGALAILRRKARKKEEEKDDNFDAL